MSLIKEAKIIKKNTVMTMITNAFLAVIKLLAGIFGRSSVLISDAINSIGDIATNVVVYISAIFSRKEKDNDHPYGHEKFDSIIAIFLGVAIAITAFEVGKAAVNKFIDLVFNDVAIEIPAWYTLAAAILTILVKEVLFRITIKDAKTAKSSALTAQAWDHRSDTIASFGASIGILGAMFGFGFLDPIASFIIALFILRLAIKIIISGVSQVVDQSADESVEQAIRDIIESYQEVCGIDMIKTRQFGLKIYVDLEICLDYKLTLEAAHAIAEKIHDQIESDIPEVLHCMIHINPSYKKQKN